MAAVLQGCGQAVLKSPKNFNDENGLAMTLFQLDPTYDRAVVEVGMFELGEIRRLCQIAQPPVGEHAARVVDALFTVGPRGAQIAAAARAAGARTVRHFDTKEEAVEVLRANLGPDDVLLVKASRGLALGAIVAQLIEKGAPETQEL